MVPMEETAETEMAVLQHLLVAVVFAGVNSWTP